jgi:hypothetical protein
MGFEYQRRGPAQYMRKYASLVIWFDAAVGDAA